MLASQLIKKIQEQIDEHGDCDVAIQTMDNKEQDHFHGPIMYVGGCHWNNPHRSSITIHAYYESR